MQSNDAPAPPELPLLTAIEARALGCLIEKEAITPDVYPLSVNATLSAANQKTARDPVMNVSQGEVHHALRQLEQKGFARQSYSSRAERYEQCAGVRLGLPPQQVALIGLLLLRGAQTAHELLARSERLAKFSDIEDLRHHLTRLIERSPTLALQLPRGHAQREDRYVHLLCGAVDVQAFAESESAAVETVPTQVETRLRALEDQVTALREQIAALQAELRSARPGLAGTQGDA